MIKFGTDGWRGRIADDFTFTNLRLVTQALVEYLFKNNLASQGIAVGYDNRFQSEHFARAAAEICSGAGIETILCEHPVPSPALSLTVKKMGLGAGIMITASHNPAPWNGFKIKEKFGGSAFPETTQAVENNLKSELSIRPSSNKIKMFDPDPIYLEELKSLVDLDLIRSHQLKIIVDPMFGSGAGYLRKLGLDAIEIRGQRDPLFGGINPEPLPLNLEESFSFTRDLALKYADELTACIVLDGDADRIAAIDGSGRFITTHNIFCLLLRHLYLHRRLSGKVVKTFNLSNLIDKLCRKYKLDLTVTPIGFKYIARLILEKDILLGGEESGGMGIKGYLPERDGILAGLFLLELMVYEKRTLAEILDEIMNELGYFYYDRMDIQIEKAQEIVTRLSQSPPSMLAGEKIARVENLDGLKFNFADESWILFRASGTEPLLRIYAEARSPEKLKLLLGGGENFTFPR
jgi:phosphomannomutase